jgi:hypothetical protein
MYSLVHFEGAGLSFPHGPSLLGSPSNSRTASLGSPRFTSMAFFRNSASWW